MERAADAGGLPSVREVTRAGLARRKGHGLASAAAMPVIRQLQTGLRCPGNSGSASTAYWRALPLLERGLNPLQMKACVGDWWTDDWQRYKGQHCRLGSACPRNQACSRRSRRVGIAH